MTGGFARSERLRARGEFLAMRGAPSASSGRLVVAVRPNALGRRRLGLTASSRVGGAVVRNRVKRWLREMWRQERARLAPSLDVLIVARPGIEKEGLPGARRAFLEAIAKLPGAVREGEIR